MRLFAALLVFVLFAFPAMAAEESLQSVSYSWTEPEAMPAEYVDHDYYNLILGNIVFEKELAHQKAKKQPPITGSRLLRYSRVPKGQDINTIPYSLIKKDFDQYIVALQIYIYDMKKVNVSRLNRDDQLAYWLNVRNALVLEEILTSYPVNGDDLQDLYFGSGSTWTMRKIRVEGQYISIQDIEEKIVPGIWNDPLILYGFFYGAKGGPFIMNQAFTGENVYTLLEENARAYLNSSNIINVSNKLGAELPIIYVWHADLFGGDNANVLNHVRQYADKKLLSKLKKVSPQHVSFGFDWALNELTNKQIRVALQNTQLSNAPLKVCDTLSVSVCSR